MFKLLLIIAVVVLTLMLHATYRRYLILIKDHKLTAEKSLWVIFWNYIYRMQFLKFFNN